jgi:hypothetical protein
MVIFFDLDFASLPCNYLVTLFSGTGRSGGGGEGSFQKDTRIRTFAFKTMYESETGKKL